MKKNGVVHFLFCAAVIVAATLQSCSADEEVRCCTDNHEWGPGRATHHCLGDEDNANCNDWCMQSCRGGECNIRSGLHKCHCYC